MNLFRLLLLFLLLLGASSYAGGDARQEKMCWAHYVGWGFNQSDGYDKAALSPEWMLHPFNDRTLLGRDLQWNSGIFFGARKQIDAARAYGFDGFCVDVVDPAAYVSALSRFFRDAEGTTFKIALCIDRLNYPDDYLLKHLGGFIRTYKDHPNACRIDGKMVIFVYNIAGKSWRSADSTLTISLSRCTRLPRGTIRPGSGRCWTGLNRSTTSAATDFSRNR